MNTAYISIGSNLDDPAGQVRRAVDALRNLGNVLAVSSLYLTKPWGDPNQPMFINAVDALETTYRPIELLLALKSAESTLGRDPEGRRWGPRIIDFDILTYGDQTINEPDLKIPHPHMKERAFVLVPLAELDEKFAPLRDALPPEELQSVSKL